MSKSNQEIKDAILDFINTREGVKNIKLNDFIKSLYPAPSRNAPAEYLLQTESKRIKYILSELQNNKLISMSTSNYMNLGAPYYEGEQQYLRHWNINNVEIIAQK